MAAKAANSGKSDDSSSISNPQDITITESAAELYGFQCPSPTSLAPKASQQLCEKGSNCTASLCCRGSCSTVSCSASQTQNLGKLCRDFECSDGASECCLSDFEGNTAFSINIACMSVVLLAWFIVRKKIERSRAAIDNNNNKSNGDGSQQQSPIELPSFGRSLFNIAQHTFTLFDFVTDCLMCALVHNLWKNDERQKTATHRARNGGVVNDIVIDPVSMWAALFYLSVFTIVTPFVVNAIILFRIYKKKMMKKPDFYAFYNEKGGFVALISFLACSNLFHFKLFQSRIFGLRIFSLNIDKSTLDLIDVLGLVTNFIEDIPQIFVQIIVISSGHESLFVFFSLFTSICALSFMIVSRVMRAAFVQRTRKNKRSQKTLLLKRMDDDDDASDDVIVIDANDGNGGKGSYSNVDDGDDSDDSDTDDEDQELDDYDDKASDRPARQSIVKMNNIHNRIASGEWSTQVLEMDSSGGTGGATVMVPVIEDDDVSEDDSDSDMTEINDDNHVDSEDV
jgi:hypothetical protein